MKSRALLIAALLVAFALVVVVLVAPVPYLQPIETHQYGIAHESTAAFDSTIEETSLDPDETTARADLSESTQRALEEPRTEADASGGWEEITVAVCHESVRGCGAYEAVPDFPEPASEDPGTRTGNTYGVVEDDGERYVVETRYGDGLGFAGLYLLPAMVLSFVLYAFYLIVTALLYLEKQPTRVLGCTTYGLVLLGSPTVLALSGTHVGPLALPLVAIVGLVGTWFWYSIRLVSRDSTET